MFSGYQTCKQVCHWLDAAGKRNNYSPLLLKSSRGRQEDYEAAKWLHSRTVCHALHSPQGCWEILQGEGLAYNHHFKLIKEQIKKWDNFLGGAKLTKKPHCSNVSVAGLLLVEEDLPLCMASHTHNSPCAPSVLLGWWGTNKVHSEHGLSQGHTDREKEVRGTEYTSSERIRVCKCVQSISTKFWMVQKQSQSWGCSGQGRYFSLLTIYHFPDQLQK